MSRHLECEYYRMTHRMCTYRHTHDSFVEECGGEGGDEERLCRIIMKEGREEVH